jgi:hypothetical protein
LAGTTVTNTGPSTISGDLGVNSGSAVTGFPPGIVEPPSTTYAADSVALGAQNDLTTAYTQAAGEGPPTQEGADLTGLTLGLGVYGTSSDGALGLNGALTLNGGGDPNAVFIFQTGATLITGTRTVMALTSITLGSGVTVNGRVLARTGGVTLIDDTINAPACSTTPVPVTGAGGPSGFGGGLLLGLGGLALLGAGVAIGTTRRRRVATARDGS